MRSGFQMLAILAVAAMGCEDMTSTTPRAQRSMAPEAVGVAPGTVQDYAAPAPATPDTTAADPATTVDPATVAPPATEPVREKAEAGVTGKGQNLGSGIITTPAKAFFQARERLIFTSVEHAVNLYRATEGRLPQTHEEFMQKVIEANQIKLPELPAGSRYVWDPEQGELMVERGQ